MKTVTKEIGIQTAHKNAVFVDRSNLGLLKVSGETRVDLIHRMSTQDLRGMQSGEGRATVLTTEIGRIIDRLIVYTSSDTAYLLTSESNADNIARYLMRFVFFNDDFRLEDVSAQTAIFGVYGVNSAEILKSAGFPETDLSLHHWRQVDLNGTTVYLHRTDPIAGNGYLVMCAENDREATVTQLTAAGTTPIDAETFDYLRIESGQPRFGQELTSDYIPLESGLWDDISFSKGCYIGQEIIARMESRGKLAKKLFHLRADAPVSVGDSIVIGEKNAGVITSAANGYALGYIRTKFVSDDQTIRAGEAQLEMISSSQAE